MSARQQTTSHWLASAVAFAGSAVLVYWWRLSRPLWVDEEMLALNARWRAVADLAGPLWLDQTAPLGWLTLERAALLTFGIDERAARALPTLFGIFTLAVAVWIGRRWMTPFGAVVLAALLSIGPWLVFFTLELKHYSADVCWALLLPALAAWALEADGPDRAARRAAVWWGAAAAGLWLSNGATFVAPACAGLLVGRTWYVYGVRGAARVTAPGIIWLISLSAHYMLALRHALGNEYLANYWNFAFPPVSDGIAGMLRWVGQWFHSFAVKPVGASRSMLLWVATAAGFAYAFMRHRMLGAAFAMVPVSALALGFFHIVPPFERLGLWCVPAVYVGVALCADAAYWLAFQSRRRSALAGTAAIAAALLALTVSLDIVHNGRLELGARRADNNYGLNDRSAVRRVLALRQPGDPVLTTHFGLAGLWWYTDVNLANGARGAYFEDSPLYEISHERRRSRCAHHAKQMEALIQRTGRLVVYLGFRMNVEPPGFDKLVLDELGRRGAVAGYQRFADSSHVAAFDFRQPPNGPADRFFPSSNLPVAPPLSGCVAIRPARRW